MAGVPGSLLDVALRRRDPTVAYCETGLVGRVFWIATAQGRLAMTFCYVARAPCNDGNAEGVG
jgi:hypothetical protein